MKGRELSILLFRFDAFIYSDQFLLNHDVLSDIKFIVNDPFLHAVHTLNWFQGVTVLKDKTGNDLGIPLFI